SIITVCVIARQRRDSGVRAGALLRPRIGPSAGSPRIQSLAPRRTRPHHFLPGRTPAFPPMLETLAAALPSPVAFAIPVFMLLIVAEVLWSRRHLPTNYELRDTAASILMGFGNLAIGAAYGGVVYAATNAVYQHRLVDLPEAWWVF